jgi:hypothetical protein
LNEAGVETFFNLDCLFTLVGLAYAITAYLPSADDGL